MNLIDLILFFVSTMLVPFGVSWYVCPPIVKLAKEKNLTDCPGNRKLQTKPVPVVGGLCVFAALIISMALFSLLGEFFTVNLNIPANVLIAMSLIFLVGFFDDMVDLRPSIKFLFQFATIGLLCGSGYMITTFNGLFGVYDLPVWLSWALSLFAGVGMLNALNMIDGVNGLSSGVGISFSLCSSVILFCLGDYTSSALALMFLGALIPFFIANAFSLRYKMFIGDSGSLMLGTLAYILICSILKAVQGGAADDPTRNHSVALVVSLFAVPVFDTLRVMTMRIVKGKSPFSADKTHLHHILLELKVPHLAVTAAILLLGAVIFLSWIVTNWWIDNSLFQFVVVMLVSILGTWGIYSYLARCRKDERKFSFIKEKLVNLSSSIRRFRRRIEARYDARQTNHGFFVPGFDDEDE